MKFPIRTFLWIIYIIMAPSFAIANPVSDLSGIRKHRNAIMAGWKTYNISPTEPISLYGARVKKFFTENAYWGEFGFGALTGRRSGYLEGGLVLGWYQELLPKVVLDACVLVGAGGGGSAPQGGGLIANPTIGLGYHLSDWMVAFLEFGYIRFLNGDIASPTVAIQFHTFFWDLTYEANK